MRRPGPIGSALLSSLVLGALVGLWAFVLEPARLTATDVVVPAPDGANGTRPWPGPPVRVAFVSDLHAGAPHVDRSAVRALVDRINARAPDVVLLGGDLTAHVLGATPFPLADLAAELARLSAPWGRFAVLGNHDWWTGADATRRALEAAGFVVLENASVRVASPGSGGAFRLVGIGDDHTGHARLDAAFAEVAAGEPVLAFLHDPGAFVDAGPRHRFDVALAGHLHGGQIAVPLVGALVTPGRAPRAWARGNGGWTPLPQGPLFVTRGIGTSVLPARLGAPPEFVVLELGR